ncbi:DUF3349 domain-containing protein [Brachybacterium sp. DNPG3]
MTNPVARVLGWLRAGYPEGVPPQDVTPLLVLLTRTLAPHEVEEIVAALIADHPDGGIGTAQVRDLIEERKHAPVTPADVRQVAARLAAAGWPLSDSPEEPGEADGAAGAAGARRPGPRLAPGAPAPESAADGPIVGEPSVTPGGAPPAAPLVEPLAEPNPVQRLLAWFSVGYPEGVPATDRVPLLALLRRRLTDEEAAELADRLIDRATARDADAVDPTHAGVLITRYTDELPSEDDMSRLASHLAARGWPLRAEG